MNLANFLDYLPFHEFAVPRTYADEGELELAEVLETTEEILKDHNELGIIAILVEESLMDNFGIGSSVMTYAENIQASTPHSKAVVIEVSPNESTYKIASLLEKLYFEGVDTDLIDGNPINNNQSKEDNNQLIGMVGIGDIPIPVVHENGLGSPSIYPYVDFYRKKYIYSQESETFELNDKAKQTGPEIWHGIIKAPSQDPTLAQQEIESFLEKNNQYKQGNVDYTNFEKRVLYANFPAMEAKMNHLDYSNYQRLNKYLEEMTFSRYNKNLLKSFIADVSESFQASEPVMSDEAIEAQLDINTENIIKKYATNFAEALRIYRSGINQAIQETGRWSPGEVDTPESLIAIRDEYAKAQLFRKQLELEKEVDEFIEAQINENDRAIELTTSTNLNVSLELANVPLDQRQFSFFSHIDGIRLSEIENSEQCGIQVGQQSQISSNVLENNSVAVRANRMYNTETLITPPDSPPEDWSAEDELAYKEHGGCVANNSIEIEETGGDPAKCKVKGAHKSLFDIRGSKAFESEDIFYDDLNRCSIERTSYLPGSPNNFDDLAAGANALGVEIGMSLADVINDAYSGLGGEIESPSIQEKANYVIQRLLTTGVDFEYELLPTLTLNLSLENNQTKTIDSLYSRKEPTNETIKAIKQIGVPRVDPVTGEIKFPQITTPSLPADGNRLISFIEENQLKEFEYLNLFRIQGETPGEILGNWLSQLDQKQNELNQITGVNSGLFESFFVNNPENASIIEPLSWKNYSVDQKLLEIIPKYVNRDSFLPTPDSLIKSAPKNKPEGYEVLHIVAEGDSQGYDFGLNRTMMQRAGTSESSIDPGVGTEGPDLDEESAEEGIEGDLSGGNYVCGDPSGVEIWEWYDSLQCWMENEILPAQDLFSLSQSCTEAPAPIVGTNSPDDIFDELLITPQNYEAEINRGSLVLGQEEPIKVSVYNELGEPLFGYVDTPVEIEVENSNVGEFKLNNFHIYAGEREVDFVPQQIGSTQVVISMGELESKTFELEVLEQINLQWETSERIVEGKSQFNINVTAVNSNDERLSNINDEILLESEKPGDGFFENEGMVELINGQGQIKFNPNPGIKEITLVSQDPFIEGRTVIKPSSLEASKLNIQAPKNLTLVSQTAIEIHATDDLGVIAENFNGMVELELAGKSADYASLENDQIEIENGKGNVIINTKNQTADIRLIVKNSQLESHEVIIPLMARMQSQALENSFPQTLFASLIGFPAGDISKENYFGGRQLINGKTQAVYSFLSSPSPEISLIINPNQKIETYGINQSVLVNISENSLIQQVYDRAKLQSLLSKKTPLNFNSVEKLEDDQVEVGSIYVDILDSDYSSLNTEEGIELYDNLGQKIATVKNDNVQLESNSFKFEHVNDTEFDAVEINIVDTGSQIARIIMSFPDVNINPETLEAISPVYEYEEKFSGSSTSDPKGLIFFEKSAEVEQEAREEFYGIQGENRYLSYFANGSSIGEAVKFDLPSNAILLGDPSIKLETKSDSGLNFNSANGEIIFKDTEGAQIASINHFNFNNDGLQDVAVLMDDGRIKLIEAGNTNPPYKDKGSIAVLADGGVSIEAIDLKGDNYEDLLVATDEGRLAVLNNDQEVITRIDQKINIGEKLYKLRTNDMDKDGFEDIVALDSKGDLFIFYYDPSIDGFEEDGLLLGNYGLTLKLDEDLSSDLAIRFSGMPEPSLPSSGNEDISEAEALEFYNESSSSQELQGPGIPKLPWPEGAEPESYFESLGEIAGLNSEKRIRNASRPGASNIDVQEKIEYEITIQSNVSRSEVVIADTLPDSLAFDPSSVKCLEGSCNEISPTENGIKLFFNEFNLAAGEVMRFSYQATIENTPQADFLIQAVNEPNENLENPNAIIDEYLDVLISPPFNNTGQLLIHYTQGPREYELVQSNNTEEEGSEESAGFADLMTQLESIDASGSSPAPPIEAGVMGEALEEATGNNDCFEDPDSSVSCAEQALDKLGENISNFACMGGGCFPTPYNRAFLVPPQMPLPIFAFPATLATPVGPLPSPASLFFPLPGMASIPGPIFSALRFYLAPTLTGGMGVAMCWGPYPTSPVVPPPAFPIPYPPPVGNCIVTAIPADTLWGGLCSEIEAGVNKAMDFISAGVDKINSGISSINDNPNIPVNVTEGGPAQGAGGLEVSLAINLGEATKFDPPIQGFSNVHIPTFDSIGGAIAKWTDRQLFEITNKLLRLPTFSIFLPDFKSLFTADFEKTDKSYRGWINTLKNIDDATGNALENVKEFGGAGQNPLGVSDRSLGQELRAATQNLQGSKALQYTQTIETAASIYNLNALEGLYDVASTLPLVRLTEKPIQFRVPWLSTAEIQAYIIELQNFVIYYEQEYDRVKDKWERLTCAIDSEDLGEDERPKNATSHLAECQGRKLADAFGATFDELILSAKENIEVLQSYLAFPKTLVNYKQQMAGYLQSISCYLDIIAQMMGGYMATIQNQMVTWAETALTIAEVVKNIKELFNVFTSFDTSCETCMNERFTNFGWWGLLGLAIPELPIIQFPRIPDVVLDLSDVDILLDVELPILELRPSSIPLPPLPYISLPDFPNINIFLQLGPLPILPRLPELPGLPDLPPLPVIDLPTLPPPPKLPDIGQAFDVIIPLIEKILQTWCIMKKSLAPVPELMLNDQITLLTNRPAYLTPFDLAQVQLPNIAPFDLGFNELRIETELNLDLGVNVITKPIETASEITNNGEPDWEEKLAAGENAWPGTDNIPELANQAYQTYLDETEGRIQGYLDLAGDLAQEGVQFLEEKFDEYVQGWIDKNINDPLQEADAWLNEREDYWEEWARDNDVEISYDEYNRTINNLYETISQAKDDAINEWFDENRDIIRILAVTPWFASLIDQYDIDQKIEIQWLFDFLGEKINQGISYGPTMLNRTYACIKPKNIKACKENPEIFFGETITQNTSEQNQVIVQAPVVQKTETQAEQFKDEFKNHPQSKEIQNLFGQLANVIKEANNAKPVDYRVLKEKFGVQDYAPELKNTSVDRLIKMRDELELSSEKLLAEAEGLRHVRDLNAIAGVGRHHKADYELASSQLENERKARVVTNAIELEKSLSKEVEISDIEKTAIELKAQVEQKVKALEAETPSPAAAVGGCQADLCLPDPITSGAIPVIPNIEALASSETVFMPNGNLVYSDGDSLYLKRDLSLDDTEINTDNGNPQHLDIDQLMSLMRMETKPKGAINMLKSTFSEDGAATFNWLPVSDESVKGYGIELEKAISGYESGKEENEFADTKLILLPANEDGTPAEAFVNGDIPISYGTLVTSLADSEEAIEMFGIVPSNVITQAEHVHFPGINNAQINVSELKAVYFDQLQGNAYSLQMINGYHHVKMTWFDENARTATYNKNEILAPQSYASSLEPIEISQELPVYYAPIYKEISIPASDLFVDISGNHEFYWFMDTESENYIQGETLTIPAQKFIETLDMKVVASKDINDDSFNKIEQAFKVEVYAPEITLEQEALNNGIIKGELIPIEEDQNADLSDIPFGVYRKRGGVWKNVGQLNAEDESKLGTNPEIEEPSFVYYSEGSQGVYEISGFENVKPSPVIIKDHEGELKAEVQPGLGIMNLYDETYELIAVPGSQDTPTRIAVVEKGTEEIISNLYYISETTEDVTILDTSLTAGNVASKGTTVGDANVGDQIIARSIPAAAPSFPGGAAIFNETSQKNIALVDKDGSIRMMDEAFELGIKNGDQSEERYIFQIQTKGGDAVFDIFIQADWASLEIDTQTQMDGLEKQIGLKPKVESKFAQAQENQSIQSESPFNDLDASHPFFKQIVELFEARVVSGYDDGSFKPDQKLTRAEFVKIALGVTNCFDCEEPTDPQRERYNVNPFPDVSLPAWYFYCISIAKELGMITGYGDGQFRPEQNISRAEAAAVLLRQSGIEISEAPEGRYTDVPDFAWYVDYVHTAVEIGLIQENFGIVGPDVEITRGEFAFMAAGLKNYRECRLVDEDGDGIPDWWEMTHNMDPLVKDAERACPCFDNPNQQDSDGDGRRDVCDLDIDNDGILNPMCIFDDAGEVSAELILLGSKDLGEPVDNCIFTPNPDQKDFDGNGIGDSCEACPCTSNPNLNDTDGDGVRDVCDVDIDGDTVTQPICIFDQNGLLDQSRLTPEADNCVFDPNPFQEDEDGDGIGNVCDLNEVIDLCPDVPEDIDGVDDGDGCPEVNDAFGEKTPGIYIGPGPLCGFIDYWSDINEGDVFMTVITDLENENITYSKSEELTPQ